MYSKKILFCGYTINMYRDIKDHEKAQEMKRGGNVYVNSSN